MTNSDRIPIPADIGANLAAYVRGFVDELLGRHYHDGVNPEHSLTVCIPPTEEEVQQFSAAAYRAGRLAGMAARN
jgi:hypothetical protein